MHIASIVKVILTTIQLKRCFREERNPRGLWKGCLKSNVDFRTLRNLF